jgi:hypothetical protein
MGAHSVPRPPWTRGESRGIPKRRSHRGTRVFAGNLRTERGSYVLLAMQKVEGSNPFSRSRKGLHLQVFSSSLCAQSAGASASPGTQWVPAARPQREALGNRPVCRSFVGTRTCDLLRRRTTSWVGVGVLTWFPRGSPMTARLHLAWRVGASRQPLSLTNSRGGSTARHARSSSISIISRRSTPAAASTRLRKPGRDAGRVVAGCCLFSGCACSPTDAS